MLPTNNQTESKDNLRDFLFVNLTEKNWNDLEWIMLLNGNPPSKMYSYDNVLPKNYLLYLTFN